MKRLLVCLSLVSLSCAVFAAPQKQPAPKPVVKPAVTKPAPTAPVSILLTGHSQGQTIMIGTQTNLGKAAVLELQIDESNASISLVATPKLEKDGRVTLGYVVKIVRTVKVEVVNGKSTEKQDKISIIGEQTAKMGEPMPILIAVTQGNTNEPGLALMLTVKLPDKPSVR